MRIGTLFSGIGAPEQGAKRVYGDDLELVFACEYDKFARQSFEANYEISPEHFHKDVHDMDGTQYQGKLDVLIGGSPCQSFSIAGLRNGTDDERGQLIYQYIRIVGEVKAPIIVYENVKGMLSIDGGKTIRDFVQALRDIGYFCHYEVVNTKDYGVPQNRERIFLVGFIDHEMYHRFNFQEIQPLRTTLKDIFGYSFFAIESKGRGFYDGGWNTEIAPTLTSCSWHENHKILMGLKRRKATPIECLLLQDFPATFKQVVRNSQMYKQAGNSMSVNVLEMIFRQIEKAKNCDSDNLSLFNYKESA